MRIHILQQYLPNLYNKHGLTARTFVQQLQGLVYPPEVTTSCPGLYIICISGIWVGPMRTGLTGRPLVDRAAPPGPGCCTRGNIFPHHAAPLGFHRAPPPINTVREDAHSWETSSPASLPGAHAGGPATHIRSI